MKTPASVRWLIRSDMETVQQIEQACFPYPWDLSEFLEALRQCNCIGNVVESDHEVVGFMIYELRECSLELVNMAIDPWWQREGLGSRLIEKLIGKLSDQHRRTIFTTVGEENLRAQLFFRHHGFRAVETLRGLCDESAQDAYRMRFDLRAEERGA